MEFHIGDKFKRKGKKEYTYTIIATDKLLVEECSDTNPLNWKRIIYTIKELQDEIDFGEFIPIL